MSRMIADYDPKTAPTILVPVVGHRRKSPVGIVARHTTGDGIPATPRELIARDIKELKRVYPEIPSS